jgi:hypothetical protein
MEELVTPLAAVLQTLLQKEQRLDQLEVEPGAADRDQIELWRRTNLKAIEALEQAISCLPAGTLHEAAVQALIAEGTLNGLLDELPEAEDIGVIGDRIEAAARLIKAALPVIASNAGLDLVAYGGRHYRHSVTPWPFPSDVIEKP